MNFLTNKKDIPVKVEFTSGKDFNLTGSEYIGYFNIKDGIPYASKFEQKTVLTINDTTNNQILFSSRFNDRTTQEKLSLKYNENDILFEPNEIVNKNSINSKLELLYENFLEIFNFSRFLSPELPLNFTNFIVASGFERGSEDLYEFVILPGTGPESSVLSADLSTFDFGQIDEVFSHGVKNIGSMRNKFIDRYTLFLSVSNSIFAYDRDDLGTTFNFVNSTNSFGIENELVMDDIVSLDHDKSNTLYVADSGLATVFEIDVGEIVNLDRTGLRTFRLINSIGGTGIKETNFSELVSIVYSKNNVYIYDKGNKDIKNFDRNLNFIKKYNNDNFFTKYNVIHLEIDPYLDQLYIVTEEFRVLILDIEDFRFINEFTIKGPDPGPKEEVRELIFSENNSNVFYLLTNVSLYKYLKSNYKFVGRYFFIGENLEGNTTWDSTFKDWNLAAGSTFYFWDGLAESGGVINFSSIDLIGSSGDNELLSLFSDKRIITLKEKDNIINFLDDEDLNFYEKSEILFDEEYFNNITLNTAMYKMLFNMKLLANSLNKKLITTFESGIETFNRIEIINADEKNSVSLSNNDFLNLNVGNNEPTAALIFNRQLKFLLDYQNKVKDLLKVDVTNTLIPKLSTVTF